MKIVVTKDEFAKLIRYCEKLNHTYGKTCDDCVLAGFCQGETMVEDYCEIESSVNFSNGLVINPCDFTRVD